MISFYHNVIHARENHIAQWKEFSEKLQGGPARADIELKIVGYAIIPLDEYAKLLASEGRLDAALDALNKLAKAQVMEECGRE